MFTIYTLEETIQVPPYLFGKPRLEALEHMLNKRFADKLIPNVGLGIGVWDIVGTSEDRLVSQTGEASTRVVFRLVVYRPFVGEVMFSRINASTQAGLFLEVGFFDGVHVPEKELPKPVSWDDKENVWIWRPEGGAELFMDVSNECVSRVSDVRIDDSGMWILAGLYDEVVGDNQGLGDPLWWYEEEEGGEGGEGEEGEEGGEGGEGEYGGEDGGEDEQDGELGAEEGVQEGGEGGEEEVGTGEEGKGSESKDEVKEEEGVDEGEVVAEEAEEYEEEQYPDEDYEPEE